MPSTPPVPGLFSLLHTLGLSPEGPGVAERLGHAPDTRLLIVHADDLGVAHSVNAASLDALERGCISSASVMMPCPWVTEVAAYARTHPDADLGVHLTLTSEWRDYRWGPVAARERVPSLLDADGTLPRESDTVARRAELSEVERELRAQVDLALALGIRPTHLDSHMGALFTTPELFATFVRVARDYGLPFLALRAPDAAADARSPLVERDVVIDALEMAGPEIPRDGLRDFYLSAIRALRAGVTELIVHPGRDDAELQAVTVGYDAYGSAWRQRDYDVVTSAEFRDALREHAVTLIGWKDLQTLVAAQ